MKANARATANVAQKRGKIRIQPCVRCGASEAQKHHPDYNRPLFVVWLCRQCHLALHAKENDTAPYSLADEMG